MASTHDKQLHRVIWKLDECLGLEDITVAGKEVNLYKGRRLVAQPDIVAIDRRNNVYIVEYKVNDNQRTHAIQQLQVASGFLRSQFKTNPRLFYIHGDMVTEEV